MNRPVGSQYGNDKGRPYGVIVPTKHYNSLPDMIRQVEHERIKRGWSNDRLDMEACKCISTFAQTKKQGRAVKYTTLVDYANALGMKWVLTKK
jgi:hypothetical protein